MCGIAGYYLRKPIKGLNQNKLIDTLLDAIDWRGGEATGLAAFGPDGLIDHQRAGCDSKTFTLYRRYTPSDARIVLLHTRLATQGHPAFVENNHPVVNQRVFVTHNGHVSNDRELWHEIGSWKRTADVDSEIIPAVIAQHGWESADKALEKIEGSMAIAAVHADHPNELLLAKGEQSPLIYFYTDTILMWASTEIALMEAWAACVGTPPKSVRLKQLKLGDWLKVRDGEIETGKFEVAFDFTYNWKNYNTTSKGAASDSGTTNVTIYSSKGTKSTKKISSKTVDEWLKEKNDEQWERANLKELTDEINSCRARADEILAMEAGWWDNPEQLSEFNGIWDRIRVLRDLHEEHAWAEMTDQEDEDEQGFQILCPGCSNTFPIGEMEELDGDDGALYCWDCADEWQYPTITKRDQCALPEATAGELEWKTIAPGTEIMVRVDPDTGEEIA